MQHDFSRFFHNLLYKENINENFMQLYAVDKY